MKRCVIIGGAGINRYDSVRERLREDDFFVFCDSGLRHMDKLGVRPDLIVGDFDSHADPQMDIPSDFRASVFSIQLRKASATGIPVTKSLSDGMPASSHSRRTSSWGRK